LRFELIAAIAQLFETMAEVHAFGGQQACDCAVQIGAMEGVIGGAKFLLDQAAERRAQKEAAVVPAPLIEGAGLDAAGAKVLGKPEPVQQP